MDYRLPISSRTRARRNLLFKAYLEAKKKSTSNGRKRVARKDGEKGGKSDAIDVERGFLDLGFVGYLKSESLSICNGCDDAVVEVDEREFYGEGVGSVCSSREESGGWKMAEKLNLEDARGSYCDSRRRFGGRKDLDLKKGQKSALGSAKIGNAVRFDHVTRKRGQISNVSAHEIGNVSRSDEITSGGNPDDDENDDDQSDCCEIKLDSSSGDDQFFVGKRRFREKDDTKVHCAWRCESDSSSGENEGSESKVCGKRSMDENSMTKEIQLKGEKLREIHESSVSREEDKNDVVSANSYESESLSEELDASDDMDYDVNKSANSASFEQSSFDNEDTGKDNNSGDNDNDNQFSLTIKAEGDFDHENAEGKREDCLVVNMNNQNGSREEHHSFVACRTRSRYRSTFSKRELEKFGTISHPFCVDEEMIQSSSDSGDDDEDNDCNEEGGMVNEELDGLWKELEIGLASFGKTKKSRNRGKRDRKKKRKLEMLLKRQRFLELKKQKELEVLLKRKRNHALSDFDVHKTLVNSVFKEGKMVLDELDCSRNEPLDGQQEPLMEETVLPLRFTFGVEEPEQEPEKSELEEELDYLWRELDLGLASSKIGSSESHAVHDGETMPSEVATGQESLCRQGRHHFVLDEEIGVRCKFCSYVNIEIKHVMSPFCEHPFGRSEHRDYGRVASTISGVGQFQGLGCGSWGTSHDPSIPPKGTVWDIIPGIKHGMYPHQQEGFEFMWKNIAGSTSLEDLSQPTQLGGGGCIISHAPGTGKTRLAIVFLQTYTKLYKECRPMIVAPCNMLLTWEEEFRKWSVDVPFHNLNNPELSGKEDRRVLGLLRKYQDLRKVRLAKLYSWEKNESILGISYRLFEQLAGERVVSDFGDGKRKKHEVLFNAETEKVRKMLLKLPGLLVLDEGHIPRNDDSLIFRALLRVETKKFIILSGTPFQNSLSELYNTLCLVRPHFLDAVFSGKNSEQLPSKRSRMRAKKTKLAFLRSLTNDFDLEELRARIRSFVHVHKGNILEKTLPGLRDFVVLLRPSSLQRKLLEHCRETYRNGVNLDYRVSLVSLHPSLACKFLPEKGGAIAAAAAAAGDIDAGVKMRFVMELIRLSMALDEKVLVFSQFIRPLMFIREKLQCRLGWRVGREMLVMSGELDERQRKSVMGSFNGSSSAARVLLASTRACSEGISLVGASRVVLLDTVWNPAVERQAVGRAYRIGQEKVVHVYHLITAGTHEGEKHGRQIEKERLSELVFCGGGEKEAAKIPAVVLEDKILEEMVQHDKLKAIFEKIYPPGADSNFLERYTD
ncbi:hypothetical protein Nepgr_031627 [Nepenthes gracilis]|uniref:Uncharacterized protein n=1 Tax=Nepenthes gracilis TaxID=150966 RepID=A0AAD3TII3_NEPGR|nr:hypothetical protein Nepgr_031627 [Nepenthes gracilis]